MKSFIITEQQIVDCFKLGEANDPAGLLKLTATLPEHIPVALEADPQPGAPKDWSGHEHYGDCHYCEINEQYSKQAACWVCLHLIDRGKVDNWQPRTP